MAVFQLRTFKDIIDAVREELQISSGDTTALNRIKRDFAITYNEVVGEKPWGWLQRAADVQLPAAIYTGSASVTLNSNVVTLSVPPTSSVARFKFAVEGFSEIYTIESHTAGSGTLRLSDVYAGNTNAAITYKIWTERVPLPTDLKDVIRVYHDFNSSGLAQCGIQEFRRISNRAPRTEARPAHFCIADYVDPVQAEAVTNLPAVAARSSSGMLKSIRFASSVPDAISSRVAAGEPVKWRISAAGHPSYNGDVLISAVSTTTVANDTVTYTGRAALQESATADASLTVSALTSEADYSRYRELLVYPAVYTTLTTLHIEYTRDVLPLENDEDEPVLPLEDRIVLFYGTAAKAWARQRNEGESQRNRVLYETKLAKMAGRMQGQQDSPKLAPSRLYLGAKRAQSRRPIVGDVPVGGGSGGVVISGIAGAVAVYGADGVLSSSSSINATELSQLDGVTSNVQTQINTKEPTIAAGSTDQYWRGDKSWQVLETAVVQESVAARYFTEARARESISAASGDVVQYDDSTGIISLAYTPEDLANKDTDILLAADSDTRYPSQKAIKAYVDAGLSTKLAATGTAPSADFAGNVTGIISLVNGGTGATGATAARYNLAAQKNYNGINDAALFTLSYAASTRTLTVTYGAGAVVWVDGTAYPKSGTASVVHSTDNGKHYFYFDSTGTLVTSTVTWNILTTAQLATAYYRHDATPALAKGLLFDERHPGGEAGMPSEVHRYNHKFVGTQLHSTPVISGYTLDDSSNVPYAVSSVVLEDEDLRTTMSAQTDGGPYPLLWVDDASGLWTWDFTSSTNGLSMNGGNMRWNNVSTGVLTEVTQNLRYINMWPVALPLLGHSLGSGFTAYSGYAYIVGQAEYTTLANAQAVTPASLLYVSRITDEGVVFARLTYIRRVGVPELDVDPVYFKGSLLSIVATAFSPTSHTSLSNRTDANSHPATAISADTTGFDGLLGGSDTSVQLALNTLDNHTHTEGFKNVAVTGASVALSATGNDYIEATSTLTITLPAPAGCVGKIFTILNASATGTVSVTGEAVNGITGPTIDAQWGVLRLVSNGTAWRAI